jgi:hypothetical protein
MALQSKAKANPKMAESVVKNIPEFFISAAQILVVSVLTGHLLHNL